MSEKKIKRREFIGGLAAGAAAASLATAKPAYAKDKFRWKMATTWPPRLPILQDAAERFAKQVKKASGGRLKIKVYAAGELIPPFTLFDAVSSGDIEMGSGGAYYWAGKIPASQFFSSVPFGMNAQQMNAWFQSGDGLKLWEETYQQHGLIPVPFGNTGVQGGGWFRKELKSAADLKGLKIRMPGFGGRVLAKAGANVVLMPAGDLYTALERGTIDATEWVGPFQDERLGFYRAAKNFYYPGWHEPSGSLEMTINTKAWETLPEDLQYIVRACARDTAAWVLERQEAENGPALKRLVEKHGVKVLPFPDDILKLLKKLSQEVLDELVASDPQAKKVYTSYKKFMDDMLPWSEISERAYSHAQNI